MQQKKKLKTFLTQQILFSFGKFNVSKGEKKKLKLHSIAEKVLEKAFLCFSSSLVLFSFLIDKSDNLSPLFSTTAFKATFSFFIREKTISYNYLTLIFILTELFYH